MAGGVLLKYASGRPRDATCAAPGVPQRSVGASHRLANNTATDNGDNGVRIFSDDNKLQDHFAADHGSYGVEVLGATGNRLTANVRKSNSAFDLAEDNPNCDPNRWRRNTGTRSQDCIR